MPIPESVLCDIDGVLGDVTVPIIDSMNREFGTKYKRDDWTTWDWPMEQLVLLAKIDISAAATWLFSAQHYLASPPILEAQRALRSWADQGTRISVATSRSSNERGVTMDWLSEHYPFIHSKNIHIRTDSSIKGNVFKYKQAENLQPKMYFEDEAATVQTLLKIWPQNMLAIIRLIDQPWNRNNTELDLFRTSWDKLGRY